MSRPLLPRIARDRVIRSTVCTRSGRDLAGGRALGVGRQEPPRADPLRDDDLRRRQPPVPRPAHVRADGAAAPRGARRPSGTRRWCSTRRSCWPGTPTRTSRCAGSGRAGRPALHLLVLLLPLVVLPIALPAGWIPPGDASPIPWLLALLAVAVGLPFFAVSGDQPGPAGVVRRDGPPAARDPYVLYAASNLGSMLALLAYPVLVERLAPSGHAEPTVGVGLRDPRRAGRRLRARALASRRGRSRDERTGSERADGPARRRRAPRPTGRSPPRAGAPAGCSWRPSRPA